MEPLIGQVMMFAGNFAPEGWLLCDGQILPIAQYTTLYSLLGTTYGGDGRTSFGLPNLKCRAPMGAGNGPGLTNRLRGAGYGGESVTLNASQMAAHNHDADMQQVFNPKLKAVAAAPDVASPEGAYLAQPATQTYHTGQGEETVDMHSGSVEISGSGAVSIDAAGGNQAHDNTMPFLCVNFIICHDGLYPERT